jgi:hypothetical protein
MAWELPAPPQINTIAPGITQRYWFRLGGGQDRAAQFMMASPLNPGGFLLSRDFSKERISDGTITYWATVANIGSFNTNFRWQGGGLF